MNTNKCLAVHLRPPVAAAFEQTIGVHAFCHAGTSKEHFSPLAAQLFGRYQYAFSSNAVKKTLLKPVLDAIWAKLDAGSQEYFERVDGTSLSLDRLVNHIAVAAVKRPLVLQCMFMKIDGKFIVIILILRRIILAQLQVHPCIIMATTIRFTVAR